MDDGQHVLDHFLFGTEAFLVHHHKGAVMGLAHVFDYLEAEAAKAVAVGHDQTFDPPMDNSIEDSQEVLAVEIQAAADFLDPLVYGPAVCRTKLFQYSDLVIEVRLLSLRRHPCIDGSDAPRQPGSPVNEGEMFVRVESSISRRALWLEASLSVPALKRVDGHANKIGELPDIVSVHITDDNILLPIYVMSRQGSLAT